MTYSIVALDETSGTLGAAVQSHWFGVGGLAVWAEAGVGAVATQAQVERSYGPLGLRAMSSGERPAEALERLLAADGDREVRQVAMIDPAGSVAAHTGASTIPEAGHRIGAAFSVQANMMRHDTVWDAMAETFGASTGDLAHRMLDALDAAEREGGDIRGRQSAGIVVVSAAPTDEPWDAVVIDVRVEDLSEPLPELRRLVDLALAYRDMDRAEELELVDDMTGALELRLGALARYPDAPELAFWSAISLALEGRIDEAREAVGAAGRDHDGWEELARRLVDGGLVDLERTHVRELFGPGPSG